MYPNSRSCADASRQARVADGEVQYYHFDDLGSTVFLTGSDGTVTDEYTYDAWGNLTSHTGDTNQPYQYVGQLGYYTHWQDPNLDLLHLGVRFYDPEIGRFTQRDPLGFEGGLNHYAYVDNSPAMLVDPSGLVYDSISASMRSCMALHGAAAVACLKALYETVQGCGGQQKVLDALNRATAYVNGTRGFANFRAFKSFFGRPAQGYRWHHIVEQRCQNLKRFGAERVYNIRNSIQVPTWFNQKTANFYSSKRTWLTGKGFSSVREWMNSLDYEQQYWAGRRIMEYLWTGKWPKW